MSSASEVTTSWTDQAFKKSGSITIMSNGPDEEDGFARGSAIVLMVVVAFKRLGLMEYKCIAVDCRCLHTIKKISGYTKYF